MMIKRNNLFALLVSAALLCAHAASADSPVVQLDYGIETSSSVVLMPSSTAGSVVLTCDKCNARSYRLTGNTTYKVGNTQVSFAEFSASLHGTARGVMLFVKSDQTVVRMTASAAAVAQ